jgi:ABC-2 type transport system permease protein
MGVRQNLSLVGEYLKINLSSLLEYKANAFIGITSMFVNDIVWIFYWFLIMSKFEEINGWGFTEILQIYAILTISWGIIGVFFGNRGSISHIIENGGLDFYLATPANVLLHLLTSKIELMSIGDLLFGIVIAFFCVTFSQIPLFILLVICAVLIITSYIVIYGSLAFFFGSAKGMENLSIMGLLGFSTYPFSVFGGFTKFMLLTVIPVGFISGFPIALLKQFSWTYIFYILIAAVVFVSIAIFMFSMGLRRYESGNMIVARM